MLEALLGSLSAEKRSAYVLHTIEGLSAPQISAITGVKTRTIYSRLRAAKAEIEASARRVQARARNDDAVRRLAKRSTSPPPHQLRMRGWAALTLSVPELAAPVATAAATTMLPWLGALGGLAVVAALAVLNPSAPRQAHRPSRVTPAMPEMPSASAAASASPVFAAPAVPRVQRVPAQSEPISPTPSRAARAAAAVNSATAPAEAPMLGLLPRARMELKSGRAQHALALLRAHALAEPDSPLAVERTSTMLLALCALGRAVEARGLAQDESIPVPTACVVRP
ncbi:MAG: sigma-70 region 4 domain-containing protein [Nannocystaceae bacterium]|nr:sigma-70 region 4 domain-containing protein [Nannocystaceae bacterium]